MQFGISKNYIRVLIVIQTILLLLLCCACNGSTKIYAAIPEDSYFIRSKIGIIENSNLFIYWLINLARYLGWAGTLIGFFITIALLIYKLILAQDQETMKKIQESIVKALLVLILGLVLLSGSFIISQVGVLFGKVVPLDLDNIMGH